MTENANQKQFSESETWKGRVKKIVKEMVEAHFPELKKDNLSIRKELLNVLEE